MDSGEDPTTLYKQSNLISATWDTLGWVLDREGKVDEALNYLHPARWISRVWRPASMLVKC